MSQRRAGGRATMLWTLQSYIFRELGKTFALSAAGLTAVVALGGGAWNVIGLDEVTPELLGRVMLVVLLLAGTLTLPVAALFSATATYGRLSADNEFQACRGSGINIHRLFAPCLLISAVSALFTFALFSYVIPGLIRDLNALARRDVYRLVEHGLKKPSRLGFGNNRYRVYADRVEELRVSPEQAAAGVTGALRLHGGAFVRMSSGEWEHLGFAERVDLTFASDDGRPTVQAEMLGVSGFDRRDQRWFSFAAQPIDRLRIPLEIPRKVKWLNLRELLYHRIHPEELPELSEGVLRLRSAVAEALFYQSVASRFRPGQPLELGESPTRYTVQAPELIADPEDGRCTFTDVTIHEWRERRQRTIRARRATFEFEWRDGGPASVVLNVSEDVTVTDPANPAKTISKHRDRLDPIPLPGELAERAARLSLSQLLDAATPAAPGRNVARLAAKLRGDRDKVLHDIAAELHWRSALSASVFVLVVLGAALGIVLRGAQLLTAFGISFVPALLLTATIIAGKHLAENAGTASAGVGLMWAGIAVVAGLDVLTLMRILPR